jgi:hypothetical protein
LTGNRVNGASVFSGRWGLVGMSLSVAPLNKFVQ